MSSAYLSTPAGNEQPFAVVLSTTSLTTLVTAASGSNGKRVTKVRCAEMAGSTPTLLLDIYDGTTSYKLRGAKAMTAYEVVLEEDIRLLPGWSLRAQAGTADQIHCTGLYVDISRGAAG